MATEVGDLNIIQDEDLLRRMWQQTEDFSRKKEIRQRMYKLREERLKSYYITRETTTSGGGGDVSSTTVTHHKPAVTSHAESFANQGFLAMKTKEIRDSASSPTIEFHQQSSTSDRYCSSDQGRNSTERSSSQQQSSYKTTEQTSSSTLSSSYTNEDGDIYPTQTYAITYERGDNPTETREASYSSSSSTQHRYSNGGSTQRDNSSTKNTSSTSHRTIGDNLIQDATNDQSNSDGHYHTESIKYTSVNGQHLHPVSRQNSNLSDVSTRKIFREDSNQPSRSVSRENSNLRKTSTTKCASVNEQLSSGKITTKTSSSSTNQSTSKDTPSDMVDSNSHYKSDSQSRSSRVSVETSATHNAFVSSLRASPDRSTPSPTTAAKHYSTSRSSAERSTPEVSPRVSPEKSNITNDLSKKYTASFQHRISSSSSHLKSNTQSANVVSSTSEYESDDSNAILQKHGASTTKANSSTISNTTNKSHAIKSPDSSPERIGAFRPIVSANTTHHGRKETDISAQAVTLKGKPVKPIPKVAPASQSAKNTPHDRTKPDSVAPSMKSPVEPSKVDKIKPSESTASETTCVASADTKRKPSPKTAAGKRRSATCNSFTTPSSKGKPAKTNYSSGSSESSSTESDSDSSDDECQQVTIEEIVDEEDKVKVTNGETTIKNREPQSEIKTSKINNKESTDKFIRSEKGGDTPAPAQPATKTDTKRAQEFIQQEKMPKTAIQSQPKVKPSAKIEEQTEKVSQKDAASTSVQPASEIKEQLVQSQCEVKTSTKIEQKNDKTKMEEKRIKMAAQPQNAIKISSNVKEQQMEKRTRQEKIENAPIKPQSNIKTSANEVKTRPENKINVNAKSKISKIDTTTKKSAKSATNETSAKLPATTPTKQASPSQAKPEHKVSQERIKSDAIKKPTKRVSESSLREKERKTNKSHFDSTRKTKSEALIESIDKSNVTMPNIQKPVPPVKSSPAAPANQKTVAQSMTSKTTDEQLQTTEQVESAANVSQTNTQDSSDSITIKVELTDSTISEDGAINPMISSIHSDQFYKFSDNDLIPRLADQILTPDEAELVKRQKFAPQRLEITDLDDEAEGVCNVSVNQRKHQFLENAKDALTNGKKMTLVEGNLIEQREQGVSKTKEMFENIAKNQKPHSPEFRRCLLREPIEEEDGDATSAKMEPEVDSSLAPQSPTISANVSKIKSTFEVDTVETKSQVRVPLMRQTSLKRGTNLIDHLDSTAECVTSSNTVTELKSHETVAVNEEKPMPEPAPFPKDAQSSTTNKPQRKYSPVKDVLAKQTPKPSSRSPSPPKKPSARVETKTSLPIRKQPTPKAIEITQVEVKPNKRVYEHTTIAKVDSYPVKEKITVTNVRKSPEKSSVQTRKSTSPEKTSSGDAKNKKSISSEKKHTSRKSTETITSTKESSQPSSVKITAVSTDRKSTSPEKQHPTDDKSRSSIKITTTSMDRKSKSPEKRPTKESNRKSVDSVKEKMSEENARISKLRTKFEETSSKRQFKKSPSPTKTTPKETSSPSRPSPERKTAIKTSPERVTTKVTDFCESKTTKNEAIQRKSPERISAVTSRNFSTAETNRSTKRASPEKTTVAVTQKRSSPEKTTSIATTNKRSEKIASTAKKSSPFGITLRNVKSKSSVIKSTSVSTTKHEIETTEYDDTNEKHIEEIFDLELLEIMLEKAVKYDIRSRIRAQIRLIKRQREQLKRTSRTPSPAKSPSRETKKSTITETHRIDGTDRRDQVKKRLFTDETSPFSSSVTAATESSNLHKVSKYENTNRNSQKTNDSPNQNQTTYQNDYGFKNVTDSIVSGYGVGPTDQDGKLLFGLKALRTSNDSKSSPAVPSDLNKTTSSSESSSRMYSVRAAMQTDSSGNVSIQRQEVKGELHSENGEKPIGTVTNTQYSYHKPSQGEATVKTKTTTDVLDSKNEAAFKSKLGTTSLIRKISNEHFESAQRKFNGEKAAADNTQVAKKFAKIDECGSGNETYSSTRYSYHSSGSTHESETVAENDASKDAKNTVQQATVASSMRQIAKSRDNQTGKNEHKHSDSATDQSDESIRSTHTSTFETSERFESTSSSSSFVKNYEQNGVSHDVFDKVEQNNDIRSEYESKTKNETSYKFGENSVSLRDLDQIPKTSNSNYTVTMKSSSNVTPFKRQSSNIKRNKEINIEQIWDEDQLRNLLETCPDSELRSRIAAKLRSIMAENKNKESTATTCVINSKNDNFSSTTKVHTSKTISSSGRMVKANSVTSPFAKFHQLERHNSLPSSAAPIFKCTDPKLTSSVTSIKDRLLNWVKAQTKEYKNIQIDNFSTSWNNGLAFCALIHHFCPHAFDYNQLTPEQRRYNFELAFRVAEEEAGIAPLLDVEDMVIMSRPDWKCVFTYVQSFYQRFKATPEAVPFEY